MIRSRPKLVTAVILVVTQMACVAGCATDQHRLAAVSAPPPIVSPSFYGSSRNVDPGSDDWWEIRADMVINYAATGPLSRTSGYELYPGGAPVKQHVHRIVGIG